MSHKKDAPRGRKPVPVFEGLNAAGTFQSWLPGCTDEQAELEFERRYPRVREYFRRLRGAGFGRLVITLTEIVIRSGLVTAPSMSFSERLAEELDTYLTAVQFESCAEVMSGLNLLSSPRSLAEEFSARLTLVDAPVGLEEVVGDLGENKGDDSPDSYFSICSEGEDEPTPSSPLYYHPARHTRGVMGYSPLGSESDGDDEGAEVSVGGSGVLVVDGT
jgi:hypothetical protein